jgi:hypothetical protein
VYMFLCVKVSKKELKECFFLF